MRTPRSAAASRANGARSRGPKTAEGKRRSSANSRTHGLLAKIVVLDSESNETFLEMLRIYYAKLNPADHVEECAIEEMAAGMWRLRRLWFIEKHLIDRTVAAAHSQTPPDTPTGDRLAAAFSTLAAGPELALLGRYEARLHRMFHRAFQNFLLLREFGGAPDPEPEPAPAPEPKPAPPPRAPVSPPETSNCETNPAADNALPILPVTPPSRPSRPPCESAARTDLPSRVPAVVTHAQPGIAPDIEIPESAHKNAPETKDGNERSPRIDLRGRNPFVADRLACGPSSLAMNIPPPAGRFRGERVADCDRIVFRERYLTRAFSGGPALMRARRAVVRRSHSAQ